MDQRSDGSLLPARRGEGARRADEGRARCAECSRWQEGVLFDGAHRSACRVQDAMRVDWQPVHRIQHQTRCVRNAECRVYNPTHREPNLAHRVENPVHRVRHFAHRAGDAMDHVGDSVRRFRNSGRRVLNLAHRVRNSERHLPGQTLGVRYPVLRVESEAYRGANTAYRVRDAVCRASNPAHWVRYATQPPRRMVRGLPEGPCLA